MKSKISLLVLLIFFLTASASLAADVFYGTDLSEIRLVEVAADQSYAIVANRADNKETVYPGDRLGSSSGTVIQIKPAFIRVRTGNTVARLPLIQQGLLRP
ncbi:MAG: hypothetical protein K9K88_16865 [Desulfobacterales bacterium]|nr:hypothetical protein [Desulfobacterales bacterium]